MKASSTGTSRILLFSFAAVFLVASSILYSLAAGDGTPVTPNNFYGTLTIDGSPAAVGTRMKGMVGGEDKTVPSPYTTQSSGLYGCLVGLDCKFGVNCTVGEPIAFLIETSPGSNDFYNTGEIGSCNPGGDTNLDLTVGGGPACTDNDQDGYGNPASASCAHPQLDCNDNDASINPVAAEVCDGVDNDCDGSTDEGLKTTYYQDADADNYGNPSVSQQACTQPNGYVLDNTDCNDGNAGIHPGAAEIKCDGIDQDCSGGDNPGTDNDADTYKIDGGMCGLVDCNDGNSQIYPGANEVCNGVDDDCDGTVDEGCACTNGATRSCPLQQGVCAGSFETCTGNQWPGCGPSNYGQNYQNPETSCDGLDNDCDGSTDEGLKTTYYQDNDNDLYGNPSVSLQACTQPNGYVLDSTDCDDADDGVNPGASEICNDGKDNDCDGLPDCADSDCSQYEGCQQQEYCLLITDMRVLNSMQDEDYTIPAGTMYYIEMSTYNGCDQDVQSMQIVQVLKGTMPVNLGSVESTIHAAETSVVKAGFIMPNGTPPGTGFTANGFNWNHWIDQEPWTFEILSATSQVAFQSE